MTLPFSFGQPRRPNILGTEAAISSGHYLATIAGNRVLEAGGNAVDAGVAAGIALSVLESEMVSFAGVAPILIYLQDTREVITISGLGPWPMAANCDLFQKRFDGAIPQGILRTVVPGAPDAWITALELYGTISFGDAAKAAIDYAIRGFPMYGLMADWIAKEAETQKQWPGSAAVWLPGGRVPEVGDVFVQADLGRTLQFMADEECSAQHKGRKAGLAAARDAFYRGDIAASIVRFHEDNGGLMTRDDLAGFRVALEPPVKTRFGGIDVFGCGPWCQGPMLLQELNLLDGFDLKGMGHNSADYIHTLAEVIKLAAADRDAYYGDPRFVDVPMDTLLSMDYARERQALIRPGTAWPVPPAGRVQGKPWQSPVEAPARGSDRPGSSLDTSYVCVVDRWGNAFSATPSDSALQMPIIPGTGLAPSPRGNQSWTDPGHAACIAPGKRPRLTPAPAIAIKDGSFIMPFGTPGADVQTQMMLQVFLNLFVFGMDPQTSVEMPRIATHGFPATHAPHPCEPASLYLEGALPRKLEADLAARGHRITWWPEHGPPNTSGDINGVCLVYRALDRPLVIGAADPRRVSYALGR